MKACPYCAEEIKDEAIKCRWCLSWLVSEVPRSADTPPAGVAASSPAPPPAQAAPMAMTQPIPAALSQASTTGGERVEFTHSGERYLLGYSGDHFGIWDRGSPAAPTERYPRTDEGWRQAWQRYVSIESNWMDLRTGQRS